MELRVAGLVPESIVDGKGIRFTVFTQGCFHNCEGCHNPETHDPAGGKTVTTEYILEEFKKDPILKGITFSGGEPFLQPEPLTELAKAVHAMGKDVWTYSGFLFEDLLNSSDPYKKELLMNCDVLIDGKFVLAERNLELRFRGSENQRVIDIKTSINSGKAVSVADIDEF